MGQLSSASHAHIVSAKKLRRTVRVAWKYDTAVLTARRLIGQFTGGYANESGVAKDLAAGGR